MARPKYDHPTVVNYLNDYGVDLEARRVFLHHPVSASEDSHSIGLEYVIRNLLHLDKWNGTIELWVNTPGGYHDEMWALIDVMRSLSHPVCTVAFGSVASCGCLILASGTGTRYAMPHASFMWHGGTTGLQGGEEFSSAVDQIEWEKWTHERWLEAMAEVTRPPRCRSRKQRIDYWRRWGQGRQLWLPAEKMLEHGIVDEIWSRD